MILPTVALAELMVPMSEQERAAFNAKIAERFLCVPFDTRAAYFAVTLWQFHRRLPEADRSRRQVLKADVLIIASAYAAGARVLYSHDRACRRLADGLTGLAAHDLPSHSDELEFPP